jgi:hypothetical protein
VNFYAPFALGDACQQSEPTEEVTAGAGTVEPGGRSSYSAELSTCQAATRESAEPAEASVARPVVWRYDSAPLGYRVCREIALGDLHICLSADRSGDGGPTSFEVPGSVIHLLLTGEKRVKR